MEWASCRWGFRLLTPIREGGPYRLAYRDKETGASEDAPHGPPITQVQPCMAPSGCPCAFSCPSGRQSRAALLSGRATLGRYPKAVNRRRQERGESYRQAACVPGKGTLHGLCRSFRARLSRPADTSGACRSFRLVCGRRPGAGVISCGIRVPAPRGAIYSEPCAPLDGAFPFKDVNACNGFSC